MESFTGKGSENLLKNISKNNEAKDIKKTLAGKLKLGCNWVLEQVNVTKHTSKVLIQWLKDNKDVKELE